MILKPICFLAGDQDREMEILTSRSSRALGALDRSPSWVREGVGEEQLALTWNTEDMHTGEWLKRTMARGLMERFIYWAALLTGAYRGQCFHTNVQASFSTITRSIFYIGKCMAKYHIMIITLFALMCMWNSCPTSIHGSLFKNDLSHLDWHCADRALLSCSTSVGKERGKRGRKCSSDVEVCGFRGLSRADREHSVDGVPQNRRAGRRRPINETHPPAATLTLNSVPVPHNPAKNSCGVEVSACFSVCSSALPLVRPSVRLPVCLYWNILFLFISSSCSSTPSLTGWLCPSTSNPTMSWVHNSVLHL